MKLPNYYRYFFILGLIVPFSILECKLSLKEFTSYFGAYPFEDTISKEFDLSQPGTLVVKNLDGNITVKTGWKQNKVCLTAIKKTAKEEQLAGLLITHKINSTKDKDQLTINTVYKSQQIKGAIDYLLIVPVNTSLFLSTINGDVLINEVNGTINAKTAKGKITVNDTTNNIVAHNENGPVTINHARGAIKIHSDKGDINLIDASGSIVAQTNKGHISSLCPSIAPTNRVVLHTDSGAITLALPTTVNANFYGKTDKGKLICELPITIKPITTKLDNATWKRFMQEVDGILGTGEAEIRVSSTNGNIKVIETG